MASRTLLAPLLALGFASLSQAVWKGHREPKRKFLQTDVDYVVPLDREILEIGLEHAVEFQAPIGPSNCKYEEGYECVAMVTLASFVRPKKSGGAWHVGTTGEVLDERGSACPGIVAPSKSACSFFCGVLYNTAYHVDLLKNANEREGSKIKYDLIVMHDESIEDEDLQLIRDMGARTLLITNSLKHLVCRGYYKDGKHTLWMSKVKDPVQYCTQLDFKKDFMLPGMQLIYLQSLKLTALTLTEEYAATVQVDIDMQIRSIDYVDMQVDYFLEHPEVELISETGYAPVSAFHYVMATGKELTKIWIEDLAEGFDEHTGWPGDGKPSKLTRDGVEHVDIDWMFIGNDRDQGLLTDIFQIKRDSFYARVRPINESFDASKLEKMKLLPTNFMDKLNEIPKYNHCEGKDNKPWGDNVCTEDNMDPPSGVTKCDIWSRRIEFLSRPELLTELLRGSDNEFVEQCMATIKTNHKRCTNFAPQFCDHPEEVDRTVKEGWIPHPRYDGHDKHKEQP